MPDHAARRRRQARRREAIEAISHDPPRLCVTGDAGVDSISRAGLDGLTAFLIEKTALEPGDAGRRRHRQGRAGLLSAHLLADRRQRADADARPRSPASTPICSRAARCCSTRATSSAHRHRRRLGQPGDGAPARHPRQSRRAAAGAGAGRPRADQILLHPAGFPGRFTGSPLWVEASLDASNAENRPVRTGDGVSPIMITANDFAGAWAIDENGDPLLPTVPSDPMQRDYALPRRRQHHDVHADRQLQIRPGARAGPARTAGPVR